LREYHECEKLSLKRGGYFEESQIDFILICLTLFWVLHIQLKSEVYIQSYLAIMTIVMFGGKWGMLASRRTTVKHGGGSIMLWGCLAAGGTGALHKIDGFMREENYVDILKQHLKTAVRKLKLGRKWVFQIDDPKHTSKVMENGLRLTKSRYWSGHHKALT
jgi:hypothetical protein